MVSSNQDGFDPYSSENLGALEDKLGVCLRNRELLKMAISTRAARNEHPELIKEDNERLEFLGDSVLKFLISENLFKSKSNPTASGDIPRIFPSFFIFTHLGQASCLRHVIKKCRMG